MKNQKEIISEIGQMQNMNTETLKTSGERRCARCQTALRQGAVFCPECGYKNEKFQKIKSSLFGEIFAMHKMKFIIGFCVSIIAIISVVLIVNLNNNAPVKETEEEKGINFKEMFAEYEGEEWCEFGEDGSWMRIDTNPNDEGFTQGSVGLGMYLEMEIPEINKKLGFPDSVNQKMYGTTYNDGLLEEETDNVKMSWRYSDQKGLELLYENG